jgi:hypothetical protein
VVARSFNLIKHLPWEAMIWLGGLVALAFLNPHQPHFTICPFKNVGFDFCPGCGLGSSISLFLHGEFASSLNAHPLGIIAFCILTFRIVQLTKTHLKTHGTSH